MPLVNWVKAHKLITFLSLVIIFLLFRNSLSLFSVSSPSFPSTSDEVGMTSTSTGRGLSFEPSSPFKSSQSAADTSERVVIKNSNLSLLVKDVRKTGEDILTYTKNVGGFMVETSYNRPNESPFATITVRAPSKKLDTALDHFRSLAVKVTNENLFGTDVTEEYTDIKTSLDTYAKIKAKYEAILEKATTVEDILTVQEKLITLQQQIDALKGEQQAIEQNAAFSKVTLYVSTDELALPYTPDQAFRPDVVFKYAVRSLLNTLRIGAEMLIWVGVYSVIWLPALLIFFGYRKWRKNKMSQPA